MSEIHVIGIDSSGLGKEQKEILTNCKMIVGGDRLLEYVQGYSGKMCSITPLAKALEAIHATLPHGNVGVLASGDPLFYGIGKRLLQEFMSTNICFFPALSSLQEASARFKLSWDDAEIISLHGRRRNHLAGLLLMHSKSFVFTDREHAPNILASEIIAYCETIEEKDLLHRCRMLVAENIGSSEEKISQGSLEEIAGRVFSDLNVVCILVPEGEPCGRLGLSEAEIAHSRGLITKNEVRAVTLHSLRLPKTGVFWDVGAGSGSISIEAARMNPELTVYAIERKGEELFNIKKNIRSHRCYNVIPVVGEAPVATKSLPDPDVVFVGGSGGHLGKIITETVKRLAKGGRLVVNGVIERTVLEAPRYMRDNDLRVNSSTVSISRTRQEEEPVVLNPITIMVGSK